MKNSSILSINTLKLKPVKFADSSVHSTRNNTMNGMNERFCSTIFPLGSVIFLGGKSLLSIYRLLLCFLIRLPLPTVYFLQYGLRHHRCFAVEYNLTLANSDNAIRIFQRHLDMVNIHNDRNVHLLINSLKIIHHHSRSDWV